MAEPRVVQVGAPLRMPNEEQFFAFIRSNARFAGEMATHNSRLGKSVIICGAGPSLAQLDELPLADEVWACNSALPYLHDRKMRVTHGITIDQNLDMLAPAEWARTFDVTYLLASSVHPKLVEHLRLAGRRMVFFHSYLGVPDPIGWVPAEHEGKSYEMALYTDAQLFKTSVQAGHGLNTVPRAICLALAMGFARIDVWGADCACEPDGPPMPDINDVHAYAHWLHQLRMYADGRDASFWGEGETFAEAVIDGRRWHTRPDMVISARHLLEIERACPHVHIMGDTLTAAFRDKDAAWMADLPRLEPGRVAGLGVITTQETQR